MNLSSAYSLAAIDGLVLLGLTLGMHLGKSRGCAIAIFVVSIIEVIVSLQIQAFPWVWLVVGISSLVIFNKIEKQYKAFLYNQRNPY